MKIIGARVSMFLDKAGQKYANPPHLNIIVEHVPRDKELVWDFRGDDRGGIFFTEEDGFWRTYFHNGDDQNHGGLGGAACELPMQDGSTKIIRGPWCGNPRAAKNEFGLPDLIDVSLFEQSWERCGIANFWVTPKVAREALKLARFDELPCRAVLVVNEDGYDIALMKYRTQNMPTTLRAEYHE